MKKFYKINSLVRDTSLTFCSKEENRLVKSPLAVCRSAYMSIRRNCNAIKSCLVYIVEILGIIIIIIIIIIINFFSCHRPFLPGTSLEPAVIPTAQASSFIQQYFPYYVWCVMFQLLLLLLLLFYVFWLEGTSNSYVLWICQVPYNSNVYTIPMLIIFSL